MLFRSTEYSESSGKVRAICGGHSQLPTGYWHFYWQFGIRSEALQKKLPVKRHLSEVAPEVGFEPTTNRLTVDRSTTELLRNFAPPREVVYGALRDAGQPIFAPQRDLVHAAARRTPLLAPLTERPHHRGSAARRPVSSSLSSRRCCWRPIRRGGCRACMCSWRRPPLECA